MVHNQSEKDTPKHKSGWSTITFAFIIFALGFLIGHSIPNYNPALDMNSWVQLITRPTSIPTSLPLTPTLSPSICKRITYPTAGRSEAKDRFLNIYSVALGDSLLSIAKKQMGDVSRINELINLNKARYPNLSQSSYLPVGTKLYVTPKGFPENTGDLWVAEGLVIESDPGHFVLTISPSPNSGGEDIDINSNTKFMGGMKSLQRGDCISIVIDYMGNYNHNALVIWPQ